MFSWVEGAVRRVCSGLALGVAIELLWEGEEGGLARRGGWSGLGAYADAATFFATYLAWLCSSVEVSFFPFLSSC